MSKEKPAGPTFNVDTKVEEGAAAQVNVGQSGGEATQNNEFGSGEPTLEAFYKPIIEATEGESWPEYEELPEKVKEVLTKEQHEATIEEYPNPQYMLGAAQELAEAEVSAADTEDLDQGAATATTQDWKTKSLSLALLVTKGVIRVGTAVAKSYVKTSPLTAGILEGFEFAGEITA